MSYSAYTVRQHLILYFATSHILFGYSSSMTSLHEEEMYYVLHSCEWKMPRIPEQILHSGPTVVPILSWH